MKNHRFQPDLERLRTRGIAYWRIPKERVDEVISRDKKCVYCRVEMSRGKNPKKATWEHFDNQDKNVSRGNIALCCLGCNSSKREKKLWEWFNDKKFSREQIADMAGIVQSYIREHPSRFKFLKSI